MFSMPQSPADLIGKRAVIEGGLPAYITDIFDLASGQVDFDEAHVAEVTISLGERECHFDPTIGISLTGKRLYPLSEIGLSIFVLD